MTMLAAPVVGYLIGTIPTAEWLGRLWKVELRKEGSGNPGTANALRVGGPALAVSVLLVEMTKGATAAMLGDFIAGERGILLAGLAAILGNVYNVWYRFGGGKGLGITAGVLLVAWPWVVPAVVVVIGLGAWLTRSSGRGTIVAVAFLVAAALAWEPLGLPRGWGIDPGLLPILAAGAGLVILPKHLADARKAS